ncbi:gamma-glutamyl-phosphate reductase, partial [Shewanella sp. 0m-11]
MNNEEYLTALGQNAKQASYALATLSGNQKSALLKCIAQKLTAAKADIVNANLQDVAAAKANGLSDAMIDRLLLDETRLMGVISDIDNVIG